MRKRTWCLAMAVCILTGNALNVCAQDTVVDKGWKAWFSGEAIESNFTSQDIADAVSALEPGDSVTIGLELENRHDEVTNWYMQNQVLKSLETSENNASGGAYTYKLVYTAADGAQTILYSSDSVGGDSRSGIPEGLLEATESLGDDFFYLDTIGKDQNGRIALTVALDGETQGNGYQNTFAQIRMNFAVDLTGAQTVNNGPGGTGSGHRGGGGSGGSASTATPSAESAVYSPGAVQTSDANRIVLWSALALACGLLLMGYGILCCRRDRGGREE